MMTESEKKAYREGFFSAARSMFVADHVFRSIERSVNDCGSAECVRIDQWQWDKLIRQAHKVFARRNALAAKEKNK